ncbi:hypothetical protein OS493_040286, partial [Desmophyllum pertusum]
MMTMMMSQNMQLQQLLLQQMISPSAGPRPTERTQHHSLPTVRPVEIEQVGHREMTPFTTLPINRQRGEPVQPLPKVNPPLVPIQRNPSPRPL